MLRLIKNSVRSFLYKLNTPILTYWSIKYLTRNSLYVENIYVSGKLLNNLRRNSGYSEFLVSGTGVLLLFYAQHVIKIPLGRAAYESLNSNWINYNMIKNKKSGGVVDYRLEAKNGFYVMDKLRKLDTERLTVNEIILKFSSRRKKIEFSWLIENSLINPDFFSKKLDNISNLYLSHELWSGPMHGDLTKDNIMINKHGDAVLIDLDRYTENGISSVDGIHYNIDKESKKLGISYFKYIEQILNSLENYNYSAFDLFIYFLYRFKCENRDYIVLDADFYSRARRLFVVFESVLVPINDRNGV